MLHRRQFFCSALAASYVASTKNAGAHIFRRRRSGARGSPAAAINDRVETIVNTIRSCPEIASVDTYRVDDPTMALFQWRWTHYRRDLALRYFDEVTAVNKELRHAMQRVLQMPKSGLQTILQEGLIAGEENEYFAYYRQLYYELAEKALRDKSDGKDIVTPEDVKRAIADGHIASESVIQSWNEGGGVWRFMELPILSRIGVGNALAHSHGMRQMPAEDPQIDRNAEWAERFGTQSDYTRWVINERNRHFVTCAIGMRERLVHLLVGHNHDLRPEIQKVHAAKQARITHVVISPASVGTIR